MFGKVVRVSALLCISFLQGCTDGGVATGNGEAGFSVRVQRRTDSEPVEIDGSSAVSVTEGKAPDGRLVRTHVFGDGALKKVTEFIRTVDETEKTYELEVETADGWYVDRMTYPVLKVPAGVSDATADRLIVGSAKGGIAVNPLSKRVGWTFAWDSPGAVIANFAAFWNGCSGIYYTVESEDDRLKTLGFWREESGVTFRSIRFGWDTGKIRTGYEIKVRNVTSGSKLDWRDFADLYRKRNADRPWMNHPAHVDRKDLPDWLKKGPAMVRFNRQWLEEPDNMKRFVDWWIDQFGEMPNSGWCPVIAALWGWEKEGAWWGPDYFPCHPSDEVFRKNVAMLRENRFHPFAWPSGYHWCETVGKKADGTFRLDYRDTFLKDAADHMVIARDGKRQRWPQSWLEGGAISSLCPWDSRSQDWLNGIVKGLAERGCDMVQLDQIVGGMPHECWSGKHGHPVGWGPWQTEAFERLADSSLRTLKSVHPDGVLALEEPNVKTLDRFGVQDYRDFESAGDEYAGVFSYLYHGKIPIFQSNPLRDDIYCTAWMAAEGQIPFFKMIHDDLNAERTILQNGDFEELIDNARGAACWNMVHEKGVYQGIDRSRPYWDHAGWNNFGSPKLDTEVKRSGKYALRIDVPAKSEFPQQVGQTVEGLSNGTYTVSAWVKAEPGSKGAMLVGTRKGELARTAYPAEGGWKKIETSVKTDSPELRIIFFSEPGTEMRVDDVVLAGADGKPARTEEPTLYTTMMKNWVKLFRGAGREFLANGFMIRPPELKCDRIVRGARSLPAVCHAAYRSKDGTEALMLANGTREIRRCSFRWQGKDFTFSLEPGELRLVSQFALPQAAGKLDERWMYYSCNFSSDEVTDKFTNTVAKAAATGINGVLLVGEFDYVYSWLEPRNRGNSRATRPPRMVAAKKFCDSVGVEIIPIFGGVGYATSIYHDPMLLEGRPVKDLRYVVRGKAAEFVPSFPPRRFTPSDPAWKKDAPGHYTFVDTKVSRSGASFRLEPKAGRNHGMARVWMTDLKVVEGRRYRVSAKLKIDQLEKGKKGYVQLAVYDKNMVNPGYAKRYSGARMSCNSPGPADADGWCEYVCEFTAGKQSVGFWVGAWAAEGGRIWVDDVQFEESGHTGIIVNDGCDVSVRNAKTGAVYESGKDFLSFPRFKPHRIMPRNPSLPVPAGSALKEGDELLVTAYLPVIINRIQHVGCMSQEGLYEFTRLSAEGIKKTLNPRRWLVSADEVRAGGTCRLCAKEPDLARLMARHVARQRDAIKSVSPDAEVYVWHDMFDPTHNALDEYFYAERSFHGSWKYLPRDIVVLCWGTVKRVNALKFFSDWGFNTSYACYYDKDDEDDFRRISDLCLSVTGCRGMVYTTWRKDYSLLKEFAEIMAERAAAAGKRD